MKGAIGAGLPAYSEEGLSNRDLFLAASNELLVYCEDENWEEFYIELISALRIDRQVTAVFCLGGKENLKKKLREPAELGKRRLFIFDKDFDDLLGRVHNSNEVAYLGRYSIENYFFSAGLAARFLVSQSKGLRREVAQGMFDGDALASFVDWYRAACSFFVVAQKHRLKIETTKVPLEDISVWPGGGRSEEWWDDYHARFLGRVNLDKPFLSEGDRLQQELDAAFVPHTNDVADGSDYCHLPGKHLIQYLLLTVASHFPRVDIEDLRYRFMMSSVHHLPDDIVADLSRRLTAVIEA